MGIGFGMGWDGKENKAKNKEKGTPFLTLTQAVIKSYKSKYNAVLAAAVQHMEILYPHRTSKHLPIQVKAMPLISRSGLPPLYLSSCFVPAERTGTPLDGQLHPSCMCQ
jgi:hypothetical protein